MNGRFGYPSRGHALSETEPEFETREEWLAFVQEHYLSGLTPGAPFLLITRRIGHDSRMRLSEWLEVQYYLGQMAPTEPCVRPVGYESPLSSIGVVINAERFVCYPETYSHRTKAVSDYHEEEIQIRMMDFFCTPMKKSFTPPLTLGRLALQDEGVTAISLAVGYDEIEKLRGQEVARAQDFPVWFVHSLMRLGFPLRSPEDREVLASEKRRIIAELLKYRAEIMRLTKHIDHVHKHVGGVMQDAVALTLVSDEVHARLMTSPLRSEAKANLKHIERALTTGRLLGMQRDTTWFQVDGISYQPARLLADFAVLFPPAD